MNLKHLWKIEMMQGDFNENTKQFIDNAIEISKRINEKFYFVIALSALNLLKLLRTGNHDNNEFIEIDNKLKNVNSFLFEIEVTYYVLNTEILLGEFESAYFRAKKLLPLTFTKSVNSEYQVGSYALFCNLIIQEELNRLKNNPQLKTSNASLKKDFIFYSLVLWFSCLSYPAYWGSFYRNIAWFFALLKRKKTAQWLFKKAIKCHHNLDMRYEEACSIRDYGSFLEDFCNLPGKARDMFSKAYELFTWCGAKFETDKLEGKADFAKTPVPIKTDTSREKRPSENTSGSSSGVNPVRLDTILDTSALMTEINDIDTLLKQIVISMMTATGAQLGCLEINLGMNDYKSVAMSFEGKTVPTTIVPMIKHLVNKVNETQKLQVLDEGVWDEDEGTDSISLRSDLCVPLNWRDKYLGYVYLVNDKVQGLFGEGAQKAAQILATQAGILLENALLMNRYKELNVHLQQQVESQTQDIISKNQQLEDFSMRVVDSERMKNLLSGTLVHDIKNYIAGIEGNIKLLAMKCPDHEKIQRTSAIVSNCCVDIVNLTSNLLDIAKMEEGKLEIKKEVLSIDKISSIIEKYQAGEIFQERGLTVCVKLPEKPFAIEADSYLLDRVLQNLFSNALKYAPRGGTIVLSFEPSEKENIICFYNSGNPIPDAFKETLFEKYSRLEDRQSQYSKGLGLFFCRMVMQAHDGRIWLDTDPTGNTFKMSFKPVPFFLLKNDSTDNLNDGKTGPKRYSKAM
jgi:signal transduction histidine kinase